ncbi:hypothetical protein OFM39_33090, partial [Escherichia coli]|nr:hypothetical protein [Escherichia coli]
MKRFFLFFLLVFTFLFCEAQKINTALVYSVHPAAATEKKPPVLIFLHGYGSNEADLFELANGFDPRFITFSL